MKFQSPISIKIIAEKIGAEIIGDDTLIATGINEIHKVTPGDITFSDVRKYFEKSLNSAASIIILNEPAECPQGKAILLCKQPFEAYNSIIWEHRPFEPLRQNVHPGAVIGENTIIEPGVVIANDVTIGNDCYIQANAYIGEHTIIGNGVTIQAGAIIGTDAFYYKRYPKGYTKWRSGGQVIINDNVEIGAGCTINKGVSGDTIIGEGTKLDCQVHLGHGVVIGKHCLIAAQVGIGGKTIVGDEVVIYGQVGIAQNIKIGNKVIILAKAGVSKDLLSNKTYFGSPAGEVRVIYKQLAALRQLPDLVKKQKE